MISIENFVQLNEFLKKFVPGSIADGDFYNPDKMFELLPLVGNPHQKLNVVHVAGTSGKTSTCYYTAELLRASGANVGLTVSPHIFEINERVQINGQPLSEKQMCELFMEFINTPGFVELKPTYFELLVTFAFWVFARENCSHAVIEVGLGGLKDATNIVDDPAKVAVITDIGLDHTHILGETIEKIAFQKAGIIKQGNQVFCYEQGDIVDKVIDAQVQKNDAVLHRLNQERSEKSAEFVSDLPKYQKRNWLLANEVSNFVIARDKLQNLSAEQLLKTQELIIPARMQRLNVEGKTLILDGAHNPQKIETMIDSLKTLYPNKSVSLLVSFVQSKQTTLSDSTRLLKSVSDKIIVTEFSTTEDLPHKVIPLSDLVSEAKTAGFQNIQQISDCAQAFDALLRQPSDILVITGSFYLIGSLSEKLKEFL